MSDTYYDDAPYDDVPPDVDPPRRRRVSYRPAAETGGNAYTAARRHSRLVHVLKFVLPALALIAVGIFWAAARFVPSEYVDAVSIAGIDVESNSVVMDAPRISGFEGTRRAYDVSAANAIQSLSDPKVITFNEINASLGMDQSGSAVVTAPEGIYDGNVNTITFNQGVEVVTSEGHTGRLTNAHVDLDAGSLVTADPVEFAAPFASLRANAVTVLDRGKRVSFTGGVSIAYQPSGDLMTVPQPAPAQ